MKITALALVLLGCAADSDPPTPLSYDGYFIAVFAPHASPEACIADSIDPRGCRFAITLCKDGRAAQRVADIVSTGTYDMIDGIAHATFTDGTALEFDVAARKKASDAPGTSWIVDVNNLHETPQFDTIACSN
jgi:hypothetical protein